MNIDMKNRAIKLAEMGYTPLLLMSPESDQPGAGKAPIRAQWQKITITPDEVRSWAADSTYNLGLRTGDHKLVVLDFDGMGGYEQFKIDFPMLVDTHTVLTGSGDGVHVYLSIQGDLPKSTGKLNMPGGGFVEIKAQGRQVVIPPSIHPQTKRFYTYLIQGSIKSITTFAPLADWIKSYNPEPETVEPDVIDPNGMNVTQVGEHSAYAEAALRNIASSLAGTREGQRNDSLNQAAWTLAHYVARGDLDESAVRSSLESAALSAGLSQKEFAATYQSGFQSGYSDHNWTPEVYTRPERTKRNPKWDAQRKPDREMPGNWKAYTPSPAVYQGKGVAQINRTKIVRRSSMFSNLMDRINNDQYIPDAVPILQPLTVLHKFGGQCYITQMGKIAAMIGASGSGKTSALETILDAYAVLGIPAWIWTPEWTPVEMTERALQRQGGVTQDQLYMQDIDNYDVNVRGLPSDPSKRIPENQWGIAATAFRTMRSWQEDVYFIENPLLSMSEFAEVIAQSKDELERAGMPFPQVCVFDYAQLLQGNDPEDPDEKRINAMIQDFKRICGYFGMFGWMATQTTKEEARKMDDGIFAGSTVLNVSKNSRGKKGKVRVPSSPERLKLIDQEHPNQNFDKDQHLLTSQAGRWVNEYPFNLVISVNPEYV